MSTKMTYEIALTILCFCDIPSTITGTIDTTIDYINETTTEFATTTSIDMDSLLENIRDVGYYLRAHKFNEYDRRYETNSTLAERQYFKHFPRPPLRSLHWEVHKHCEPSFMECLDYLAKKIRGVAARRVDDTSEIMMKQKWNWKKNSAEIKQVDEECKKNKRIDDVIADPFEGPLERYQWRVTASYFMCWYTTKGTPELKRFYEKCDNFANCLDEDFGPYNDDDRVEDLKSFSCASYSFCPDPCCPLKHVNLMKDCYESPENPCYRSNAAGKRQCKHDMTENTEFSDIILNRWNVTCRCPQQRGYEWNSRYGICIDLDECLSKTHNCKPKVESCLNLPGSFRCICHWGYIWDEESHECLSSTALSMLKLKRKQTRKTRQKLTAWQKFKNILFWRNSS
ncbi:unnamed protein product [Phyllotreta striolata]|uniref:EGF-like domain-containing protein n=1 Tax=Phyllotreta striolata TaxID=444603 RepID=A0A9N9XQ96_PHYSR|nr:unnamed protein product [Phyllotreta striolata]